MWRARAHANVAAITIAERSSNLRDGGGHAHEVLKRPASIMRKEGRAVIWSELEFGERLARAAYL